MPTGLGIGECEKNKGPKNWWAASLSHKFVASAEINGCFQQDFSRIITLSAMEGIFMKGLASTSNLCEPPNLEFQREIPAAAFFFFLCKEELYFIYFYSAPMCSRFSYF